MIRHALPRIAARITSTMKPAILSAKPTPCVRLLASSSEDRRGVEIWVIGFGNDSQTHGREEQQANTFLSLWARRNRWTGPHEVPCVIRRSRCLFADSVVDRSIVLTAGEEESPSIIPKGVKFLSLVERMKRDQALVSISA